MLDGNVKHIYDAEHNQSNIFKGVEIMESYIKVKNLNGTSDNKPPDAHDSWKSWWEKKKGRNFSKCSCKGCRENAQVGAHVQKAASADKKWYIVPLCNSCNVSKKNIEFDVKKDEIVPVNN